MTQAPGVDDAGDAEQLHALASPDGRAPAPAPTFHPISPAALAAFCERLGHAFADADLLGQALTHRSWCAENAGYRSNERLEFLGDSVLGLVVTDDLYALLPDAGEGQLSRMRAAVVCSSALAEMAVELDLGEVLLLGKGERASGGRERPSILADAMEAVIGAVFLDGGINAASELVSRLVAPRLVTAGAPDHKSRLHELAASEPQREVVFEITEQGPEHDKTFHARVVLDGVPLGTGVGRSKKQAEQAAAQDTWTRLDRELGELPVREEATHG
ncbi:MAG: ribonuclease [Ilumatobacteraceae bacterium]|nr:ribonuclease [Ilumatobacteraceae bacterium]